MSVVVGSHAKGWVMRCECCGHFSAVESPMDSRIFVAKLKAFLDIHENCEEKKDGV